MTVIPLGIPGGERPMEGQMIGPRMSGADSRQQPPARAGRRAGADIVHAAVLLPASLAEFAAALAGGPPPRAPRVPHAGMGVGVGTLALLPVGPEVFFVVRGVLYGVVDQGPYDNAWGGPTRAGAWLAHFGIGLLSAAAGLALLWCIAQLHRKLGARWLRGERTGAWVVPTAVMAAAPRRGPLLAPPHHVYPQPPLLPPPAPPDGHRSP